MDVTELLKNLTLEEKAGLTSGATRWLTKAVERLDIKQAYMADGPHGIRREVIEHTDITEPPPPSFPAVCFPAACLTAASFDRELLYEMGRELGRQSRAYDVGILLGPGINIKRSPLCGRNFEYFSEDPLLAGELAAEFVRGVQSEGIGTSLKHFFANNQEHRRMDGSSELDMRTMREIYLAAFEIVVKKAMPWTIMASYNKISGTFATESKRWLKDLLRAEWGFNGVVISDWGATHNRVAAVAAGCDLSMPAEIETDGEIVSAVKDGRLAESDLDEACENILKLVERVLANRKEKIDEQFVNNALAVQSHSKEFEKGASAAERDGEEFGDFAPRPDSETIVCGHALARKIAAQSIILLKNDDNILPLNKSEKIAFIGEFAKHPRHQGGGSSHVNSAKTENAFEVAKDMGLSNITYAAGYRGDQLDADDALIAEAAETAKNATLAVIFAGLPEVLESEGFDRADMRMPQSHNKLIEAVCAVQPNTVVVLHNGAPVEMPWADLPKGIIEAYLGGQAVGAAVMDVLTGKVNPSGRLPETIPYKLEDNPSYLFFGGENGITHYNEGVFVGYRYYTTKKMAVRYPFGYGLSYTEFAYRNLKLDRIKITENAFLKVSVDVTNTGKFAGAEVVQLYVAPEKGDIISKGIIRPIREIRAFDKIMLERGETKTVTFTLDKRAFAYWDMNTNAWAVENGEYSIQICLDANRVVLEEKVTVDGAADVGLA